MSDEGHNYFFNFPKEMPWKKENRMTALDELMDYRLGGHTLTQDELLRLCAQAVAYECGLDVRVLRKVALDCYMPLDNLADLLEEE